MNNIRVLEADEKGTPVKYEIFTSDRCFAEILFQNGTIPEVGVNGVQFEDLIKICINRLEHFQKGDFNCRENAIALTHLESALLWLQNRTEKRKNQGVEGKYINHG